MLGRAGLVLASAAIAISLHINNQKPRATTPWATLEQMGLEADGLWNSEWGNNQGHLRSLFCGLAAGRLMLLRDALKPDALQALRHAALEANRPPSAMHIQTKADSYSQAPVHSSQADVDRLKLAQFHRRRSPEQRAGYAEIMRRQRARGTKGICQSIQCDYMTDQRHTLPFHWGRGKCSPLLPPPPLAHSRLRNCLRTGPLSRELSGGSTRLPAQE